MADNKLFDQNNDGVVADDEVQVSKISFSEDFQETRIFRCIYIFRHFLRTRIRYRLNRSWKVVGIT